MLKIERKRIDIHWFFCSLKALRLVSKSQPRSSTPPSSMREAVKKIGGEYCKTVLPNEKTVDQAAYIKTTSTIDIAKKDISLFAHSQEAKKQHKN